MAGVLGTSRVASAASSRLIPHGHPPEELRRRLHITQCRQRIVNERVLDEMDGHRTTISEEVRKYEKSSREERTPED